MTSPRPRRIRGLDADQRRDQRREALLEAALDLFAHQGFVRTPIEQICQHAYVGTKAFYEAFTGKDDLHRALLQRTTDRAMHAAAEAATGGGSEPEVTARVVDSLAHSFSDDVRLAKVTFGEGSAVTPEAEQQRRSNRRAAAALVEGLWRSLGRTVDERYDGVAIGLIGGLFDLIADWVLDLPEGAPSAEDRARLTARLQRFYATLATGLP